MKTFLLFFIAGAITLNFANARGDHIQWKNSAENSAANQVHKSYQAAEGNYSNSVLRVTGTASTKVKQDQVTLTFKASTTGP